MKANRFISAAAAVACIAFTACSDYVGKEESHALYVKAKTAKENNDSKEAANDLEEFLTICPKSAKAHKDVAMIYMQDLQNYPFAIYHFQKFLDLSGETISKNDIADIQKYIQSCKSKMSPASSAQQSNTALIEAQAENEALKIKVAELESKKGGVRSATANDSNAVKSLKNENAALKAKIAELSGFINSQAQTQSRQPAASSTRSTSTASAPLSTATPSAPRSTATASAPRSTSTTASASGTAATQLPKFDDPGKIVEGKDGVRYYYPASGDGWDRISRKMYGSSAMVKQLQEANSGTANPQIGRMLVIPPAQKQ